MVHLHFRIVIDVNLSVEEFHIGAPLVNALLEEIHAASNVPSIDPTEALLHASSCWYTKKK